MNNATKEYATRAQVAALIISTCERLRDSGKMYAPYGTHHIRADIKKAGLNQPENIIDWFNWFQILDLKSLQQQLVNDGCMIAGLRPKKKPPVRQGGAK